MEKYDITKPMKIPVGMHKLNGEPGISFQLNRLVNMDGCDLAVAKEIGLAIKSCTACTSSTLTGRTRTG